MSNQAANTTNNPIQSTSKLGILKKNTDTKKNTISKKELLPKKKFKKEAASDEEP